MAVEIFRTDALVEESRQDTFALLDNLSADNPASALAVAMLPDGANAGIDSYMRELDRYVEGDAGLNGHNIEYVPVRAASVKEAIGFLTAHHGRPGTSIVMTPPDKQEHLKPLLAALAEDSTRDGDGMTEPGRLRHMQATPFAGRATLRAIVGEDLKAVLDPGRVVFAGAGDVNRAFIDWFRDNVGEPGCIIDSHNSSEMIPQLHKIADVVISAVGVAGLITPGDLLRQESDGKDPERMVVLDSGVSVNADRPGHRGTGMVHGDVDPAMYDYDGPQEFVVTPAPVFYPDGTFKNGTGRGIGRKTVATFVEQGIRSSTEHLVGDMAQAAN